jgi:hypothetical protein
MPEVIGQGIENFTPMLSEYRFHYSVCHAYAIRVSDGEVVFNDQVIRNSYPFEADQTVEVPW